MFKHFIRRLARPRWNSLDMQIFGFVVFVAGAAEARGNLFTGRGLLGMATLFALMIPFMMLSVHLEFCHWIEDVDRGWAAEVAKSYGRGMEDGYQLRGMADAIRGQAEAS